MTDGPQDPFRRTLYDLINRDRSAFKDEAKQIHQKYLAKSGIPGSPREALPLAWSDVVARVASDYASRCASWGSISHEDLQTGEHVGHRLRAAGIEYGACGENLVEPSAPADPGQAEECHRLFMDEPKGDPKTHRGNNLNPAFEEVGIGYCERGGRLFVVVNFRTASAVAAVAGTAVPAASVLAAAGLSGTVVPYDLPARPAPAEPFRLTVLPAWSPNLTWSMTADRKGGNLRDQLAAWLGVEKTSLHGGQRARRDGLDLSPSSRSQLCDGATVAVSLRPFEMDLVPLPGSRGAVPVPTPASEPDIPPPANVVATKLGPITKEERRLVDVVRAAGAWPVLTPSSPGNVVDLFPRRGLSARRQQVVVHVCTEIGDENGEMWQLAQELLSRNASVVEKTGSEPDRNYVLSQELFLTWCAADPDRLSTVTPELSRIARELCAARVQKGPAAHVYLQPWRSETERYALIELMARRVRWLGVEEVGQDGWRLGAAILQGIEGYRIQTGVDFETPNETIDPLELGAFSRSASVSLLCADDLRVAVTEATGVRLCVAAAFERSSVSDGVLDAEAREILASVGMAAPGQGRNPAFDPGQELRTVARKGIREHLIARVQELLGGQRPLPELRRGREMETFRALEQLADAPNPTWLDSAPRMMDAVRKLRWTLLSELRGAVESAYSVHISGRDGRNFASFVRLLSFLRVHCGLAPEPDNDAPQVGSPALATWLQASEEEARRSFGRALSELRARYERLLFKGLLRGVVPCTRSPLPRELEFALERAVHAASQVYVNSNLRGLAASGVDELLSPILSGSVEFVRRLRDWHDQYLEQTEAARELLAGRGTILVDVDATDPADAWDRATAVAQQVWDEWSVGQGRRGWMAVVEPALTRDEDNRPHLRPTFLGEIADVPARLLCELRTRMEVLSPAGTPRPEARAALLERILGFVTNRLDINLVTDPYRLQDLARRTGTPRPTARDRTFWVVLSGKSRLDDGLQKDLRALLDRTGLDLARGGVTWVDFPCTFGLHIIQETHALSYRSLK